VPRPPEIVTENHKEEQRKAAEVKREMAEAGREKAETRREDGLGALLKAAER